MKSGQLPSSHNVNAGGSPSPAPLKQASSISLTDPEVQREFRVAYFRDTRLSNIATGHKQFQEVMQRGFLVGSHHREVTLRSCGIGIRFTTAMLSALTRTNLVRLDLYGNGMGDVGAGVVAQLIEELPLLSHVNLGGNLIGPVGAEDLLQALLVHRSVQHLVLGSECYTDGLKNQIDNTVGEWLYQLFRFVRTLRHVNLNENPLGSATSTSSGARAVERSLSTSSLQHLNQSFHFEQSRSDSFDSGSDHEEGPRNPKEGGVENSVFHKVVRGLSAQYMSTLQTLKLGCVRLPSDAAVQLVRILAAIPSLTELDLHGNDLHYSVSIEVHRLIAQRGATTPHHALCAVNLNDNPRLGDRGLGDLFRQVALDRVLTRLEVAHCGVQDKTLQALCLSLSRNGSLNYLDLRNNRITSESGRSIANALVWQPSLQTLLLSGNKLGDDTACAIAGSLDKNVVLQRLELCGARIGDRGVIALGMVLASNSTLQTLRLRNNLIGETGGTALATLLERNRTLQQCSLGSNSLDYSTAAKIQACIERNRKEVHDATPRRLRKEIVRLHYQKHKLEEAQNALEALRTSTQELERNQERSEAATREEEMEARDRSLDLQAKISDETKRYEDVKKRLAARHDELAQDTSQWEETMEQLQKSLEEATAEKDVAEGALQEAQQRLQEITEAREKKMEVLKQREIVALESTEVWTSMARMYRARADKILKLFRDQQSGATTTPATATPGDPVAQ